MSCFEEREEVKGERIKVKGNRLTSFGEIKKSISVIPKRKNQQNQRNQKISDQPSSIKTKSSLGP